MKEEETVPVGFVFFSSSFFYFYFYYYTVMQRTHSLPQLNYYNIWDIAWYFLFLLYVFGGVFLFYDVWFNQGDGQVMKRRGVFGSLDGMKGREYLDIMN